MRAGKDTQMEHTIIENGFTYHLAEDGMYYPDLKLPEDEKPRYGRYGRMRKLFLMEHRHGMFMELLLDGKLVKHLNEIDEQAQNQVDLIVRQMAEKQGVNEALKACDQMAWVGAKNNIKSAAEEIVLPELIYN